MPNLVSNSVRLILKPFLFDNNLRTFVGFGDYARGYLCFARFSTVMSANWPLMSVNVFFVGYSAQCPLMVWPQLDSNCAKRKYHTVITGHGLGKF